MCVAYVCDTYRYMYIVSYNVMFIILIIIMVLAMHTITGDAGHACVYNSYIIATLHETGVN